MDDAEPIEGIGSLPRDLIIDILSRLPVKVLCTFKAVSKQWRSLISSDPHFKKLHRNRSARVPKLLLSRYDYVFNLETVSFESNVHFLTVDAVDRTVYNKFDKRVADAGCVAIACCNLMCLVTYKAIHVCNPSTQEFVRLPDNRHRPYDPIMGFGYLASENVYKLVVLSVRGFFDDDLFDFGEENPDEAYDMGCEVLTIREGEPVSGAWRDVGDLPCLAWKKNGVCVDGEIYWMALADSDGDLDKRIVVMSLGDEEFATILFPRNVFAPPVCVMELVELKGRLCLVNHRKDVSTMEIWILKDRAKCLWNMECSIHLYPVDAHIQAMATSGDNGIKDTDNSTDLTCCVDVAESSGKGPKCIKSKRFKLLYGYVYDNGRLHFDNARENEKKECQKRNDDEVMCRGYILNVLSDRLYNYYKSFDSQKKFGRHWRINVKFKTKKIRISSYY
ncbi:hypothetical protein RJ640_007719 [Escallonia rubra]|uniref:F-box domain-containing protein n=1 Tax=Escallonia rubra TaxID=112253 RepID=A0AA88R2L4_9ASTE|nr:hypothetical protein RJ640_007719 [Escallonia rubra]